MLNQNQTERSKGFTRYGADEGGPKTPTNVDVHVASKLRSFREIAGVSQEALGDALGVTFQQVQKYERGANRISPARLHAAAGFLGVTVADFYEGLKKGRRTAHDNNVADVMAALQTTDGARVCRAFAAVKSPRLRTKIANVVETIAAEV